MKRHAPATARNSGPIAEVLKLELPESGTVLEIASGTGEHAVFFARRFPQLDWQPSDLGADALASIAEYARETGLRNVSAPVQLDAVSSGWPIEAAAAVLCVNMVHISPWEATEGVFREASKLLGKGAPLILYGPYLEGGVETAPSNAAFDQSLRGRNPQWGIRKVSSMDALAVESGFERTNRYEMPANNLILVYRRRA